MALASFIFAGFTGGVYLAVMELLGMAASRGCVAGVGFLAFVIWALYYFKDWYYNRRLLCIAHDEVAIGVVIHEPVDAPDGDRKFDLVLAPFSPYEHVVWLREVIEERRSTGLNAPVLSETANPTTLQSFVAGDPPWNLSSESRTNLYQTLVYTRILGNGNYPERTYQSRFFRKETVVDVETPGTSAAIPDDSFVPNGATNPMFRYAGENDAYVYLHSEMEGYRLGAWLDNVRNGLIAAAAAWITFCVLCILVSGMDYLCGWIGAFISLLIFIFFWWLSHLFNDPDEQVAESVDVDVEEDDFSTTPTDATRGDVVVVFGDWIMDMEHEQYFEIHPVKSWYLVCRDPHGPNAWAEPLGGLPASKCDFDVTTLTAEDYQEIVTLVRSAETQDPDASVGVPIAAALSLVGGLH